MQLDTLRPRQNGHHFPDDIFQWIFVNENAWIFIKSSLKFVPTGSINNIPALFQIMAWCRPGAKPLSEPMMVSLWHIYASLGLHELTHSSLVALLVKEMCCWTERSHYQKFRTNVKSSTGPSGTTLGDIWIKIQSFSLKNTYKNVVCKTSATLSRSSCV